MELPKKSRTLALIAGGAVLIAVVYSIPVLLSSASPQVCTIDGVCQHEIYAEQISLIIPLALLAGVAIGAAAHYFFAERTPSAPQQQDREAPYRLLEADERKIVAKINEQGGRALQSEISRIEGIGKVKAHRLLARMQKRGIIEIEKYGKTNTAKLSKGVKGLFE